MGYVGGSCEAMKLPWSAPAMYQQTQGKNDIKAHHNLNCAVVLLAEEKEWGYIALQSEVCCVTNCAVPVVCIRNLRT